MNRMRSIETLKIGLITLPIILFWILAYFNGFFEINVGALTMRNIWDIFWVSAVIWVIIAVPTYIAGYYLGFFKTGHNTRMFKVLAGVSPTFIFWSIVWFKGLFDSPLNSLTVSTFWDIFWVGFLIWIVIDLILFTLGYFTGYFRPKE